MSKWQKRELSLPAVVIIFTIIIINSVVSLSVVTIIKAAFIFIITTIRDGPLEGEGGENKS